MTCKSGIAAAAIAAVMGVAAPAAAQTRNELTIDASVIGGSAGYARNLAPRWLAGIQIGLAVPQIDQTLHPEPDSTGEPDFREYIHIAAFVRYKPAARFEVDAGLRASLAEMWACQASDCYPVPFGGLYVQPMIGWRRVKVGSRLTFGIAADGPPDTRAQQGDDTSNVVSLAPLIVRGTIPW